MLNKERKVARPGEESIRKNRWASRFAKVYRIEKTALLRLYNYLTAKLGYDILHIVVR